MAKPPLGKPLHPISLSFHSYEVKITQHQDVACELSVLKSQERWDKHLHVPTFAITRHYTYITALHCETNKGSSAKNKLSTMSQEK